MARGAEAVVSRTGFLGFPAVSKDRVAKGYRVKALDLKLRKTRTRVEARLLSEAKSAGVLCPLVYSASGNELVTSFVSGERLRELLLGKKTGFARKILSETGKSLARLHSAGIVHGDFTTANVIVSGGKAWVIDFGLGGFSKELEEQAVDVLLMKRSLKPDEFKFFFAGYKANPGSGKVLGKLAEIESRGRYVTERMAE